MKKIVLGLLLALAAYVRAAEWRIEVRNTGYTRSDLVVSHEVNQQWVELLKKHTLVEVTKAGAEQPVPCVVDSSAEHPMLVWLMGGATVPYQKRSFKLAPKGAFAVLGGGLQLTRDDKKITIANADYRLWQPRQGGGGFPQDITYARSGVMDKELFFLDRIVCRGAQGGLEQYCAKDCEGAQSKLLFQSPLRAVVETTTGFGRDGAEATDRPQVTYRYIYTAFSPVIEVTAHFRRNDDRVWSEVHFMHLSRAKPGPYTAMVTGAPLKKTALKAAGEKSASLHGANWAVLNDGVNSCGAGFRNVTAWDASNEFVYYIRSDVSSWERGALRFRGSLYLGPGSDGVDYNAWLGPEHQPEITFIKDGKPTLPVDQPPVTGAHTLENRAFKIAFAAAEQGFDCIGIVNSMEEAARFVNPHDAQAGFWRLIFKGVTNTNGVPESVTIDNHAPAKQRHVNKKRGELIFTWEGLDLPGEPAVVDVTAQVTLDPATGESDWRIKVKNRSQVYGLWESHYPLLLSMAKSGRGDLVAPTGNWGGSLYKRFDGTLNIPYPSASCPLQCMAYQQGSAGLYIAAHDSTASAKSFVVNQSQDVSIIHPAPNAGVPGNAGAPEYPVVIAAYNGTWWEMARRYRKWALKQRWTAKGAIRQRQDYPQNLQELSFWMITSGGSESVENTMQRAAELFPDLTIGTHWYNWHEIPFDHSYPEYFPAKPGVAEATRKMVGNGQVIMPYINGRLWDQDIDSFESATPAACKQPSGAIYVEHYGVNSRNLVPMCPFTTLWQIRVAGICQQLVDEVKVNSIYLDQIGAAKPALCYDPTHGHPLGGGHHWVDGYRAMLTPVKEYCVKHGVSLTTENTAEPYMDNIDAYLTWNPRHAADIPLLPAVYSGYTIYFSSPQSAADTLDAFCAAQGRDFLWGCQLGWNSSWILEENHREKQRFQYELCRYRAAARDFMLYGQLLDDLKIGGEVPSAPHIWHRSTAHSANLPITMGTVWRAQDGREACFLVNVTSQPQKIRIDLTKQPQLKHRKTWKAQRITLDHAEPMVKTKGILEFEMAPHSVTGYNLGS
ncbi:MAG: DUF6259 domain-containing protein [Kiritimatiellae bacterium]|nr:DUF6259 domain-containing protein [Kiritimatiellia bacterium]